MNDRDRMIGALERRRIRVRGVVQGVGFRPFVFRLAQEMGITGWVRNDGEGVEIEAQGLPGDVSALMARLVGEAPPLARVDTVLSSVGTADPADRGFAIKVSGDGAVTTAIAHDTAVCDACLQEMFDPADRRWRHPFINCTQCGPRYTITRALPYDRANTSMAAFEQCSACRNEYDAPADRRFHAEPNACPACGPKLSLLDSSGVHVASADAVSDALERLQAGEILAIKGLGGFHLVCDARNAEAVERLRSSKDRDQKPFALMVLNAASARAWAYLTPTEERLLAAPERPIVLTEKQGRVDDELHGVAPGLATLGLMLPYAPLHYLLFHEQAGRPQGIGWLSAPHPLTLVMTSANLGGEPLVIDNDEAVQRLSGIADAYLLHDRDILIRADDSVVLASQQRHAAVGSEVRFVRRARGYTPRAIKLASSGPRVIAYGAWMKNALCITRDDEAFLSQHVGDLDNASACLAMDALAEHLLSVLAVSPQAVAHDLNPDFHSTRAAADLASRLGVPAIGVQHHHAHVAAVLAEHRHTGPALGLALDGVGLGSDGTAWGGELLLVEGAEFVRLGHLAPLALPGGDKAAREPWRMAAALMHRIGHGDAIAERFSGHHGAGQIRELIERPKLSPETTSLGRWFDAVAGLLGVCEVMSFEAEAAMKLESLAGRYGPALGASNAWQISAAGELDLSPLGEQLMRETIPARGAAVFHATLVAALDEWVARYARASGVRTIALGGGCLINRRLAQELPGRLTARGLRVLSARQAPPNDGGIALGQASVAIRKLQTDPH